MASGGELSLEMLSLHNNGRLDHHRSPKSWCEVSHQGQRRSSRIASLASNPPNEMSTSSGQRSENVFSRKPRALQSDILPLLLSACSPAVQRAPFQPAETVETQLWQQFTPTAIIRDWSDTLQQYQYTLPMNTWNDIRKKVYGGNEEAFYCSAFVPYHIKAVVLETPLDQIYGRIAPTQTNQSDVCFDIFDLYKRPYFPKEDREPSNSGASTLTKVLHFGCPIDNHNILSVFWPNIGNIGALFHDPETSDSDAIEKEFSRLIAEAFRAVCRSWPGLQIFISRFWVHLDPDCEMEGSQLEDIRERPEQVEAERDCGCLLCSSSSQKLEVAKF